MLSNGAVLDLIQSGVIRLSEIDRDAALGEWGILLHLDMIGLYPTTPQDAQIGRLDGYYPVIFSDQVRYVEVLPDHAYLVTVSEHIAIPAGYYAEVQIRPELASCGGFLLATPFICNGALQTIHLILRNMAHSSIKITPHLVIAELVISRVEGEHIAPTPQVIAPPPELPHEPPPWVRAIQEQTRRERGEIVEPRDDPFDPHTIASDDFPF